MKILFYILIIFISISCLNENAFFPETKQESLEKDLLLHDYNFDTKKLVIGKNKYRIVEAWTTYKF